MKTAANLDKAKKAKLQQWLENGKFLKSAPEVSVFMSCFGLVNEVKSIYSDHDQRVISREVFEKRFYRSMDCLCLLVESVARFDIVRPVQEYGKFSVFFWRWYNWWDDYLKAMPPGQVATIQEAAMSRSPGVERWRPRGDWLEYRSQPSFTLTMT